MGTKKLALGSQLAKKRCGYHMDSSTLSGVEKRVVEA
jgi:hypothetical protein